MTKSLMLLLALVVVAQADFFRFEMGGGIWSHNLSGTSQHKNDSKEVDLQDDVGVSDAQDIYLWAFLKHPVPLVPNVRIEYTKMDQSGNTDNAFIWNKKSYPKGSDYTSKLQQVDIALYYNLLDNLAWLTWDIGLNAKIMQTTHEFNSATDHDASNDDFAVPTLYTRVRAEIPTTAFGMETDIKYFAYGESSLSDIKVKVDYTLDFVPLVQPAIELGYRVEHIKALRDDFSSINSDSDVTLSGVYIGAMLRY